MEKAPFMSLEEFLETEVEQFKMNCRFSSKDWLKLYRIAKANYEEWDGFLETGLKVESIRPGFGTTRRGAKLTIKSINPNDDNIILLLDNSIFTHPDEYVATLSCWWRQFKILGK